MPNEMTIEIIDGQAHVTQAVDETIIYSQDQIEQEIIAIQNEIDRLEAKKAVQQQILDAFER